MRLNLSHTTLEQSQAIVEKYQNAARQMGIEPQILIDMQGPELRVGEMTEPMILDTDEEVCLFEKLNLQAKENGIPVPKEVLEAVETGDEILMDDGKLLLRVEEVRKAKNGLTEKIQTKVLRGGVLHNHKSIKVIGKDMSLPPLTEHDIANIKVAKNYGVTALMQPFVCKGSQLREVRAVLKEYGAEQVQIFAKIENLLGVENIDEILPEADVIIIARGDLGNDMPLWELPRVQKQIEEACHKAGKPYIVVTQMLASMEQNPVPTRAEVSDIYHAIYHGAWGVMLTGETAVGEYPVEAITYLVNTAKTAKADIE